MQNQTCKPLKRHLNCEAAQSALILRSPSCCKVSKDQGALPLQSVKKKTKNKDSPEASTSAHIADFHPATFVSHLSDLIFGSARSGSCFGSLSRCWNITCVTASHENIIEPKSPEADLNCSASKEKIWKASDVKDMKAYLKWWHWKREFWVATSARLWVFHKWTIIAEHYDTRYYLS